MAKAKPVPVHPLAMARAMEEINSLCFALISQVDTAVELSTHASAMTLHSLLGTIKLRSDQLRAGLWPDDPD